MTYSIEITTTYELEARDLDELHEKWQKDGLGTVVSNRTEVYDEDDTVVDEWDN